MLTKENKRYKKRGFISNMHLWTKETEILISGNMYTYSKNIYVYMHRDRKGRKPQDVQSSHLK